MRDVLNGIKDACAVCALTVIVSVLTVLVIIK
jgi:hypothetical protein